MTHARKHECSCGIHCRLHSAFKFGQSRQKPLNRTYLSLMTSVCIWSRPCSSCSWGPSHIYDHGILCNCIILPMIATPYLVNCLYRIHLFCGNRLVTQMENVYTYVCIIYNIICMDVYNMYMYIYCKCVPLIWLYPKLVLNTLLLWQCVCVSRARFVEETQK